jgi:hypothetical protein
MQFTVFLATLTTCVYAASSAIQFISIGAGTIFEAPDCHQVCVLINIRLIGYPVRIKSQFQFEEKWIDRTDFEHNFTPASNYECFEYKPLPGFHSINFKNQRNVLCVLYPPTRLE